jgi:exodeoxyribonuclease VII small subunit
MDPIVRAIGLVDYHHASTAPSHRGRRAREAIWLHSLKREAILVIDSPPPRRIDDISTMPFEQALAELESIVDQLERGEVSLEDSIAIYERGEALKKHCDALLKNAEMRIEKITQSADGKTQGSEPFDMK